jgi:hypothetical protein
MSTVEAYEPPTSARPASGLRPTRPPLAGLRLLRLHLVSRRVSVAVAAMAACAVILRLALERHWGTYPQQVPLVIEAAAAAIIAATSRSAFGEPERATGCWLPYLRLGVAVTLTAVAVGALAAGAVGAQPPGGNLELLRNVAGLVGIGLLTAAVIGGEHAWVGPIAYAVVAEYGLTAGWTSAWTWPARPPHDLDGAICAALVFAAGIAVITVRGARDSARE